MRIVADTSVLIALSDIDKLNLLKALFGSVIVPQAVAEEYGEPLPSWIEVRRPRNYSLVESLLDRLHRGEAEAIALALELGDAIVALDDKKARKTARKLGLRVIGTIGILILAEKRGLITSLEEEIHRLLNTSFRLSPSVVAEALRRAKQDC